MPVTEASLEHLAKKALELAGYKHIRIYRIYPPAEPGGEAEILFRGRCRDGCAAVGPHKPYTAYWRDEAGADVLIAEGW